MSRFSSSPSTPNFRDDHHIKPDPNDTINDLHFSPTANHLMTCSWDKTIRIYDIKENLAKKIASTPLTEVTLSDPVLSCDWSKDGGMIAGGLTSGTWFVKDLQSNASQNFQDHSLAVKAIRFVDIPNTNGPMVATASWDGTLKYWDPRLSGPVASLDCEGKVYSMDAKRELLVVANSAEKLGVVDLKEPGKFKEMLQSPDSHQTRTVRCMPDGKGFAIGTIGGRAWVKFLDPKLESKTMTFKAHRHEKKDDKTPAYISRLRAKEFDVYAINVMAFHPRYPTLATGGSDGQCCWWNIASKIREGTGAILGAHGKDGGELGEMPIVAMDYNMDGSLMAYAAGYDWSKGYNRQVKPNVAQTERQEWVLVRKCDSEVKPKAVGQRVGWEIL